jgi:hypothetical protein
MKLRYIGVLSSVLLSTAFGSDSVKQAGGISYRMNPQSVLQVWPGDGESISCATPDPINKRQLSK